MMHRLREQALQDPLHSFVAVPDYPSLFLSEFLPSLICAIQVSHGANIQGGLKTVQVVINICPEAPKRITIQNSFLGRLCMKCNPFFYEFRVVLMYSRSPALLLLCSTPQKLKAIGLTSSGVMISLARGDERRTMIVLWKHARESCTNFSSRDCSADKLISVTVTGM
jgi:hypothetical protein